MANYEMVEINGKSILHRYYLHYIILIMWIFSFILVLFFFYGGIFVLIAAGILCNIIFKSKYKKTIQNTTEYDKNFTIYKYYCSNMAVRIFFSIFMGLICFGLILVIFYSIRMRNRWKALVIESKLNFKLAKILRKKRTSYLNPSGNEIRTSRLLAKDAGVYVSNLLFEEPTDVLPVLINHPNIMPPAGIVTDYQIYYDVKKFMFQKEWRVMPGNLPPLTDIVIYIKDVLSGVKYLHDHKIYHLNLCPENILIVAWPNRHSGMAIITRFDFAIKSDQRIVDYQKVGLEWIYRPPEYYAKRNVDAAAVDYWSVGITAYEILTGGMITIFSVTSEDQRIHMMIEKEKMLELSFLSSAIEASWHYTPLLGEYDHVVKFEDTNYNISPKGFLKDTWMFVRALMHNNPKQRSTIPEALNAPFITKSLNPEL